MYTDFREALEKQFVSAHAGLEQQLALHQESLGKSVKILKHFASKAQVWGVRIILNFFLNASPIKNQSHSTNTDFPQVWPFPRLLQVSQNKVEISLQ